MSYSLAEAQQAFAAALADPELPAPPNLTGPRKSRAAKRFAIYRNNVAVSLIDALQARFPVVAKLVGEEFFRAMARAYVRAEMPRTPILIYYGGGFPGFISAFEPAKDIPYLGDVAAIEAAWTESYHAADATPLEPAALAGIDAHALAAARAILLPSVRLLRSPHPAGSIWLGHQGDAVVPPEKWAAEQIMLVRPDTDVRLHLLSSSEYGFADAVASGLAIEQAVECALVTDKRFDAGAALVKLLQAGAIAKIEIQKN